MAIDLDSFVRQRPYGYHITPRQNLTGLRRTGTIEPAATLMQQSGRTDLLRWRRSQPVTLFNGVEQIVLRDQCHLVENEIALTRGWSFGDLIEYVNEHVYFWPGTAEGPTKSGLRLQQSIDGVLSATLRIPTADLLALNALAIPLFCQFNPAANREAGGRKVRRGPHLYSSGDDFTRRESEVVELAFRSSVRLPASAMLRQEGEWVSMGLQHAANEEIQT